ncbi:hypothetical protein FXO37_15561 [Capsicum annuum]|nr:hypothetical protein FXO37_15561 [Capsicum annuum]
MCLWFLAQSIRDMIGALLSEHDWLRSIRMASYGFLLYGPGTYAWYSYLDRCMPKQSVENVLMKVLLNQIVLGPAVIAVIFAWNNLWLGKLSELPNKYQKDALPTLLFGFRFWIPVSVLNFWVIPLQARVAFMSMASIFWNFCLSATMSKWLALAFDSGSAGTSLPHMAIPISSPGIEFSSVYNSSAIMKRI